MPLHARRASRYHRDDSILDGGVADFPLIHQKHSPHGLEQNLRGLRFRRLEHADQRFDFLPRRALRILLGSGSLHRLSYAFLVERLEQIIDGIYLKRLHRILVESGGENNLGQGNFLVEKLLDDPEAIESWHLNIEKNQIGVVFLDEADGFETIL